ncbi:MAG: hypothetical protein GY824_04740 [Delftia sp.]|nr:hypothetical protein [Delftia sp.]
MARPDGGARQHGLLRGLGRRGRAGVAGSSHRPRPSGAHSARQPAAVANRRLPGRRPMSSMAPTLVFRNGQPVLALGSPGGRSIPHLLSRVLLASLIWNESPQRSVGLPHLSSRGQRLVLEEDPPIPWPLPLDQLQTNHQPVRLQQVGSGTALVQRINGRWHGAADPRREGTALALP